MISAPKLFSKFTFEDLTLYKLLKNWLVKQKLKAAVVSGKWH